jgi:DNA-directed RNA polymerase subunit M/transcription elongation factor TFIIS
MSKKMDQELSNIQFMIKQYVNFRQKYIDERTNINHGSIMVPILYQSLCPYLDKDNELYNPKLIHDDKGNIDMKKLIQFLDKPFSCSQWGKYKKIEDERIKADKEKKLEPNTSMKCNKCGGGIFYYEMQTRSSDESSTKFYNCVKCSNNWKK